MVSGILVVVADKGKTQYALIAIIPIALFLFLDSYYLALEKLFRKSYNAFIEKLHAGDVTASDLYVIAPSGSVARALLSSFSSFSIWPFYLGLLTMTLIAQVFVLGT